MTYSEQYQQLKNLYRPDVDEIFIPGSPGRILNFEFRSKPEKIASLMGCSEDITIKENYRFRYFSAWFE
jgi:hypothetical protein